MLIPKGYSKDFGGIGIVQVLWKATTGIINQRLTLETLYHDTLYGLRMGRGTGTATLEAKLIQQLTAMRETFIHTKLMYLQKTYDSLYWYMCLDVLVGYGMDPRTLFLLRAYWGWMQIVSKDG